MAAQSKNSRVARRDTGPVAPRKFSHFLFRADRPGKVQTRAVGFYFSKEDAEAAQASFSFPTILIT